MAKTLPEPSAQRPVALRMRPDLQFFPLQFRGHKYAGVKDPVSLRYLQFGEEEWFILRCLDGKTSAEEIKERFELRFAPRRLDLGQLQGFFGLLYRQGLVVADASGQGESLLDRRKQQRRQGMLSLLGNVLAFRLPGVAPQRFLDTIYSRCRWLFTRGALAAWALLAVSALLLVAVRFEALQAKLPEFSAFLRADNVFWLATALAATKIVHELAHGLACKHFGGECHEMGLMFLVFTPCLYCNVTDAWMLPRKWDRIAISAAGMYAETALASLCTFLWWFTEPGFWNSMFLNVMLVCSVSTLLFNGNPLLRFDGYFILSDLLEVPNLQPRAQRVVSEFFEEQVLGIRRRPRFANERHRGLLALYATASAAYRAMIVFAVLWFFYRVLHPQNLDAFAHLLAGIVVLGYVAGPVYHASRTLRDPSVRRQMRWRKSTGIAAVLVALAAALASLPLPQRVAAPIMLQPKDAQWVYVSVPGNITEAVRLGEQVQAGATLAQLENLDVRREIAEFVGLREVQQMRLRNLEGRRVIDPAAGGQIPVAQEALVDIEQRLEQRRRDEQRLTLISPSAGIVLPPPRIKALPDRRSLASWSGTPLDARNRGAFLTTGTPLCSVGDPRRLEAVAVVDQADMQLIRVGQPARLQLDSLPGRILAGKVAELSELDIDTAPRELLASGLLPAREGPDGSRQLIRTCYLVRIEIPEGGPPLLLGTVGRTKIRVTPQSLVSRLHRFVRQTVRFGW